MIRNSTFRLNLDEPWSFLAGEKKIVKIMLKKKETTTAAYVNTMFILWNAVFMIAYATWMVYEE